MGARPTWRMHSCMLRRHSCRRKVGQAVSKWRNSREAHASGSPQGLFQPGLQRFEKLLFVVNFHSDLEDVERDGSKELRGAFRQVVEILFGGDYGFGSGSRELVGQTADFAGVVGMVVVERFAHDHVEA